MKPTQYIRTGKQVKNVITGVVEGFKTINEAKRLSWALQTTEDKGLGRGTVQVQS